MSQKIIKPIINLIGEFDCVKDAWIASRPHLSGDDLKLHDIEDIDLPVHGAAVYCFTITGSIAARELFFMLRPQSGAWAISDRTLDIKRDMLIMSEEVPATARLFTEKSFDKFIKMKEEDLIPQDLCKKVMAYGRITTFTFICDKRTLANVVKGLKKDFPIIYEYYGKVMERLCPAITTVAGGDWLLNSLKVNKADREYLDKGITKMGRMNMVAGKIQGVLFAQFIRKIYDNVYSDILNNIADGSIYEMTQESEFDTVMYLPDTSLAKMQATRTCAFAMFDKEDSASWSYVLQVDNLSNEEFIAQLPCGGCASKCSYRKEQLPRLIAGNTVDYKSTAEVNPPCAIMTGIPGTHKVRGLKFNSDSRIYNKWTEALATLELPLTEDGKEYLHNVNTYGFAEPADNLPGVKEKYLELLNQRD